MDFAALHELCTSYQSEIEILIKYAPLQENYCAKLYNHDGNKEETRINRKINSLEENNIIKSHWYETDDPAVVKSTNRSTASPCNS